MERNETIKKGTAQKSKIYKNKQKSTQTIQIGVKVTCPTRVSGSLKTKIYGALHSYLLLTVSPSISILVFLAVLVCVSLHFLDIEPPPE